VTYQPGDRVEYIAAPVFDLIITTGEVGVVTVVEGEWVYAIWPRSGQHSVPAAHVRPAYVIERTETSNGAWRVSGRDTAGRNVQLSGEDPDALANRVVDWLDGQNGVARP
jgi:hypothetical protein